MKRPIKYIVSTSLILLIGFWLTLFLIPTPPLLSGTHFSRAIYDENHQLLRLTLSDDGQFRLYTPLNRISNDLISATLLQEDQYFQWHTGVNPYSMLKAIWQTYVVKSRRIGGSTISMQVARIRFGIHSKTVLGKFQQIVRALQLETHYTKDQLLEAYLNLAPYGNNIQGVGAASLIYYGKPADQLSLPEVLTLVVIPQNPNKRIPDKGNLQLIRNKFFQRWITIHPEDADKRSLMNLPLQLRTIRNIPFLAPHFVNAVLEKTPLTRNEVVTTLNLPIQKLVERVTHNYLARQSSLGVNNAAVILIDTRTMETKALLGSADFFKPSIGGQVDGTAAMRSPGSALKPFVYALAIDQGLIHPNTVLKDVPRSFGSYNPENFDNDFVGPIKAKDALTLSRNIPAIYLGDQLKHPSLYEFLQQGGVTHLKSENYYGLALILGGAEMSLQELASLYSTLANQGVWRPIRFVKTTTETPGKKLLSPEASYLVLDMLKETQRPPSAEWSSQSLPIAWKTGTSSGYRDAWTMGVVGPFVVGVWIGNFNNQSNHAFIGKEMAAPLFFDIIHALNTQNISLQPTNAHLERLNIKKIDVCQASGMLPTRYCLDTEPSWFIPGKSPIKTDTIHREVAIDSKTGLRTCQFNQYTRFEIFEFWSSDLLAIYKRAGIQRKKPPAYDSACSLSLKNTEGFSPQITSPQTQVDYIARIQHSKNTLIPLSAVADADVKQLYWFVNESFIGKSARDKPLLWKAPPGVFVIRVVDDLGRSDGRDVTVRLL